MHRTRAYERYHRELPTLEACMAAFNDANVLCHCNECRLTERTPHDYDSDSDDDDEREADPDDCLLIPSWEAFIARVGASVAKLTELPPDDTKFHCTAAAAVYSVRSVPFWTHDALYDWHSAGWGRPLSSLDSPRKKIWDSIAVVCTHSP
jgi:hypothetical protein